MRCKGKKARCDHTQMDDEYEGSTELGLYIYAEVARLVPHWHIRALSKQARAETRVFRDHVGWQRAGTHKSGEKI